MKQERNERMKKKKKTLAFVFAPKGEGKVREKCQVNRSLEESLGYGRTGEEGKKRRGEKRRQQLASFS